MNLSDIHVQGGELVRVLEDLEQAKLKMVVLFVNTVKDKTSGCMLVFDGVQDYQIFEERVIGRPTISSLSVVETAEHWSRVRLATNRGHREIHCTSVRVCDHESVA
jgi:hypothetical protein